MLGDCFQPKGALIFFKIDQCGGPLSPKAAVAVIRCRMTANDPKRTIDTRIDKLELNGDYFT
jgi:hypothetical protein